MADEPREDEATTAVADKVPFGQSAPGQPPRGFPNGSDVDMYGDPVEVAPDDPAQRTGEPGEIPPP